MRNPSSLKREFLKKWMMGLEIYTTSNKNMTVTQRKNAIKLSADLALASSRNCATRWSQALIAATSVDDGSRLVADVLLGRTINPKISRIMWSSGKIVKRSRRVQRMRRKWKKPAAELIARKLVRRRRKVLRGLVPGGEFMDEISLIEETLDYISALQAQVDVMRCLATAYIASSS
ncbi:transcription factor IBH1-like 1 [Cucurbita pepo subsp. pepo]|uniref:transcription factor IBH1-like 1 n=1 Tax=Cucurbita pepo subsp. pepo TaxID=3664 RepID=UPI000C9DA708|nr:transcription factor IBH1-like 1 [Cucurbita pepo subsp. pepo]XP_023532013.1 transcription factor IBH1-like 1 [Cucurbita pepo subsp. pepo]